MYIKSARFQLKNWDAQARLGSQPSQLGLAQLGKFQLKLITRLFTVTFLTILINKIFYLFCPWKYEKNTHTEK